MKSGEETLNLEAQVQAQRDKIKGMAMRMPTGLVPIRDVALWTSIHKMNVHQAKSPIDMVMDDATVLAVEFKKGGYLEPHTHPVEETIFCISGEYVDPINQVKLTRGQTQVIPANQVHAGKSDHCILMVVWEPPLPLEPIE